ncbi:TonB-dependent receptor domain-containing protein [Aurantiacibacter odishensis]|uniref:TonB-dependent receptor domain-containing protein n=1 Tax=Aurantiacibacter odishensis TaxID=1155476 RepID=UPI0013C43C23|nr:TonB-dependent receptor [Aurantiacibacter odishensis]
MKFSTAKRLTTANLAIATALISAPVFAQDAGDDQDEAPVAVSTPESAASENAIVVTGSRIRSPELTSTVPVINFGGDDIYKQSENNVGELLNDLPALRSTFSQSNPGLGIGVAGLNLLDLRGLGIERTLVLVNGRRHVAADVQVTASAVDINSIPSALIDRIDIITGGSSAVYGSDAIAGVVNFILKDDFEGIDLRASAGVPEFMEGENYLISGVAGMNFGDGRGNVTIAGEYTRQERIFASDIPEYRFPGGFIRTNVDPAGQRSDGIPDSVFSPTTTRSGTIHRYGLIGFPQRVADGSCGGTVLGASTPYNCNFIFDAAGNLVPQTFDSRSSTSQFGGFIGGNGQTGNEDELVSVYPELERYSGNLLASYEFSPAFEVFFEGKYVRADSLGSNSGPSFLQSVFTGGFNDPRVRVRLDNPFLNDEARGIIREQVLKGGYANNDLIGSGTITPATIAALNDGSYRFALNKSFLDLGIRDQDTTRETYRAVLGARGDISSNLNYEVAFNYGRTDEDIENLGNIFTQRLVLALDAGIDPADGQIKCRSQFDPDAAFPLGAFGPNPQLAGDIAACVPYNPFGAPDNAAARDYITADAGTSGTLEQYNAVAFISGDTSGFFELPGGPIGFAVGAEYRREEAFFRADEIIEQNLTFTNPLPIFDPSALEVKEAFGEISVPILADRPFFEEFTISAAGRVSDYNTAVGTVFAYNVGGRWAPIRDLAFRANWARAVRAPNYTETSGNLTQTFVNGFRDPCGSNQINQGSANRAANCRAELGAILDDPAYQQFANASASIEARSGPNANLFEETSDSLTIGAVYQPSFLPGFSITADYYDITVNDVIAAVGGQTIVNNCYDLPDLDNQFCANFERNGPTTGPNGEQPGALLQGSLLISPLNFAQRKREGIDVDVSYRNAISENVVINSRLIYTHVFTSSNFEDPTNPLFENRLLSELGDPKDSFVYDLDVTFGAITIGYGARYIGPQLTTTYEAQFPLNDDPAQNPDQFDILEYPEVLYHDIRFGWDVTDISAADVEVYFGIDNVFDKHPPLGVFGTGSGSAIFDPLGRRYYGGIRAQF